MDTDIHIIYLRHKKHFYLFIFQIAPENDFYFHCAQVSFEKEIQSSIFLQYNDMIIIFLGLHNTLPKDDSIMENVVLYAIMF